MPEPPQLAPNTPSGHPTYEGGPPPQLGPRYAWPHSTRQPPQESHKPTTADRTLQLTAGVHHRVQGLPPRQAPQNLRPQLRAAASTIDAENMVHSDSVSNVPRNLIKALPEVGVERHMPRFCCPHEGVLNRSFSDPSPRACLPRETLPGAFKPQIT
ncbi:hypothetical protein ILYODFUR_015350 [Ilyodon furcidens]|uniref:Uncharacterized protein n=1 Tax=Ilyodon furcidens TaxID=33524 RepID=A0ABV0U692_9TELE